MKPKKIILSIIAVLITVVFAFIIFNGKNYKNENSGKINIVSSNFASYDFLRAIIGDNDNINLTFLVGPGKDSHSFEPTAQDLIKIQNADLFVYIGGEMEKWTDKVLGAIENKKMKAICISKFVDRIDEEEIDGAEDNEETHQHLNSEVEKTEESEAEVHEHETGAFDEHIWTSPKNAIKMIEALEKSMEEIDDSNIDNYKKNAQNYIEEINEVDKKIQEIVDNKVRDRLVFADRMPMQYFIKYYGLKVSAAFSACSTDIEPSARTIAYLENKIKEEDIPIILHIELNNGTVAKTIAEDVKGGVEVMQIQTLHNISLDDFKNGETWVSLMTRNIEVLRKALL